jgi:hypothetical protein
MFDFRAEFQGLIDGLVSANESRSRHFSYLTPRQVLKQEQFFDKGSS